jgi:thimet oligopeptidase
MILSPQVLKKLSRHIDTKAQIPDHLIQAIRDKDSVFDKAKLKGIGIARQASLSKQSLEVYLAHNIDNKMLTGIEHQSSIEALGVYGDYYGIYDFGHLTDYSSNYYTYMWSLAISKDLFTKFNKSNLLDKKVAEHYRKTILEPGGSKPAAELVKDFLGREWNMDAFKEYLKEGEELLANI